MNKNYKNTEHQTDRLKNRTRNKTQAHGKPKKRNNEHG